MTRDNRLLLTIITCGWLCLALAGCFDWQVPDDYRPGPDGDADGDVDGDADGDRWHGEICENQEQCAAGHVCSDDFGDVFRLCRQYCESDMDCDHLGPNSTCAPWWNNGNAQACTVHCDPLWPEESCPPRTHCQLLDGGFTTCWQGMGDGWSLSPCESSLDCDIGHQCIENPDSPDMGWRCTAYCMEFEMPCGDLGLQCVPMLELGDGRTIGVCLEPMD